jgi:hypothetical protein
MGGMPVAQLRHLVVLAVGVLVGLGVPWFAPTGTTSVHASVTGYDAATALARVGARPAGSVETSPSLLARVREEAASPAPQAPRASTTPSVAFFATNTASGLGDDFVRALDDIDNGVPRPNVRNPKPFGNDGRGGTTRLPGVDSSGNPISYVEHTVNPRPPGGSLDGSRIVTGSDGSVWAATDHFNTWTRVR